MAHTRTLRRRSALVAVLAVTALAAAAASAPAAAVPAVGEIRHAGGATAIPDSYIVVLNDNAGGSVDARSEAVGRAVARLAARYGGKPGQVYGSALNGFEVRMPESAARRLAADPAVAYVEQNHVVTAQAVPWGLDRIDQRYRPLNGRYDHLTNGSSVRVYVIDTGIYASHPEFTGRVLPGYSAIGGSTTDCNGHGTHVASVVGGTIHGVAPQVRLAPVRVLDCSGLGTTADVIAGIDWITNNHVQPAVALLAIATSASAALDHAVTIAINYGVTFVTAAGNMNANACNYSPARVSTAITVGATTSVDARALYSNYGSCVNLFAPGSSIPGASIGVTSNTMSGTSMAAAHVAGGAARVLQRYPHYAPRQVTSFLLTTATTGVLASVGTGSPNWLLYLDPMF